MFKQLKNLFKIDYLLLFLIAFELYNKHHFLIFALFLLLLLKGDFKGGALNTDFLWVFLWGITYFVFGVQSFSVLHIPALICAFFVGYYMTKDKESIFKLLLVIAVGYGLEGLLMIYLSGGVMTFAEDNASRLLMSMWGGSRSFTAQDAILYIFSAILVYILINKDIKWPLKVLAIIFELGFVYNSLRTASRSPIVYCPIIIMASLIAYNSNKIKIRSLNTTLIVLIIVFVLYNLDFLGVKSLFENSYLFSRIENNDDGGMVENSRFRLQSHFVEVWDLDLWGGLNEKLGYYFHNCWLDMYAFSGILGFVTFIILTLRFIGNTIYVFRRVDSDERTLWVGVFVAFMLPMAFEPLYWGAPAYFAFFIIVYGMLSKRCKLLKQEKGATRNINHNRQQIYMSV